MVTFFLGILYTNPTRPGSNYDPNTTTILIRPRSRFDHDSECFGSGLRRLGSGSNPVDKSEPVKKEQMFMATIFMVISYFELVIKIQSDSGSKINISVFIIHRDSTLQRCLGSGLRLAGSDSKPGYNFYSNFRS